MVFKFRFVFLFILENGQLRLELPSRYACYLNITFSIAQPFEKRIFSSLKGQIDKLIILFTNHLLKNTAIFQKHRP